MCQVASLHDPTLPLYDTKFTSFFKPPTSDFFLEPKSFFFCHLGVLNKAYSDDPVQSSTASKNFLEDDDEAVYANAETPAPILLVEFENFIKTATLEQQFLVVAVLYLRMHHFRCQFLQVFIHKKCWFGKSCMQLTITISIFFLQTNFVNLSTMTQ